MPASDEAYTSIKDIAAASALRSASAKSGGVIDEEDALQLEDAPVSNSDVIDVLVAEDNEVNQIVFRQILQAAGYNFLIAEKWPGGGRTSQEASAEGDLHGCLNAGDERP